MEQDNIPVLDLDNIQEQVKLSSGKAKQLMDTCIWQPITGYFHTHCSLTKKSLRLWLKFRIFILRED